MPQASRGMKISPIPKTAPFAEDEIEILNRVVGPASVTQRAWLAGFLAGLDAAGTASEPGKAAPPARAMRAYGDLMGEGAPRLTGVEYGVLALGDTAYAEFCAIGKALD